MENNQENFNEQEIASSLKSRQTKKIFYLLPFLFGLVLGVGILIGVVLTTSSPDMKVSFFTKADHDRVAEILNYVNSRYVDSINSRELFDIAVNEIFRHLDPHSTYISAESLKRVNESLDGRFDGIGVEFFMLNDTITVISPIPGGPSERLGIRSGDKIVKIEDTIVAGVEISNRDVVDKLKGPSGTQVNVSIKRYGEDQLWNVRIPRGPVNIASINAAYMMDNSIGYIKINRFSGTTHEEFAIALRSLKNQGMEKLILDLRDNGGGYLDAATRVVDQFLSGRRLIVYTEGRAYPRRDYYTQAKGDFEEGDLVVLINEFSASASEILAGAIQDWERGTIMGRRSFGKALVQDQIPLKDGSAMRLTIARYYTPQGRSIQRPYEDGRDAYHEDYYSLISESYENNGTDTVDQNAEWGILPDVIIRRDTASNMRTVSRLIGQGLIPRFSYSYFSNNRSTFDNYRSFEEFRSNFRIHSTLFSRFLTLVETSDFDYELADAIKAEKEIKLAIKAHFAKQLFYNEGYYPLLQSLDNELKVAYEFLKEK